MESAFEAMEKTVGIVLSSPHPVNKIAATLFGVDEKGGAFSISATNYWPDAILKAVGAEGKIGNSSGTIHAETACILSARRSAGAGICVTDPFCPNCAKNIVEAGIRNVYIDSKGFAQDFAARRGDHFKSMSLLICEKAGVNIYEVNRRQRAIRPIYEAAEDFAPSEDNPVETVALSGQMSLKTLSLVAGMYAQTHWGRRFAVAICRNAGGEPVALFARAHPVAGFSMEEDAENILAGDGKYNFILEPVNRLLMNAARLGLDILDGLLYSSQVPTSREQVNMVGRGITSYLIGQDQKARDEGAFSAMKLLGDKHIMTCAVLPA